MYKTICAWCNKTAHVKPDKDNVLITHGICLYCAIKVLREDGIDPEKFIQYYITKIVKGEKDE